MLELGRPVLQSIEVEKGMLKFSAMVFNVSSKFVVKV